MSNREQIENEISQTLSEGTLNNPATEDSARKRLSHKYEIRIQMENDPIVKETELYREIAEEVDDRYDKYMNHVQNEDK